MYICIKCKLKNILCDLFPTDFLCDSSSVKCFTAGSICAQQYRPIATWPDETNARIEEFLNTTLTVTDRKVAVFDCDGTVFGQAPYYLADEALYDYADKKYKNRKDKESRQKMAILDRMVKDGNNVGKPYVEDRVHFCLA